MAYNTTHGQTAWKLQTSLSHRSAACLVRSCSCIIASQEDHGAVKFSGDCNRTSRPRHVRLSRNHPLELASVAPFDLR
jgi:hypothetical protein